MGPNKHLIARQDTLELIFSTFAPPDTDAEVSRLVVHEIITPESGILSPSDAHHTSEVI